MQPNLRCNPAHAPQAVFRAVAKCRVPRIKQICYTRAVKNRQILALNGSAGASNGCLRRLTGNAIQLLGNVSVSLLLSGVPGGREDETAKSDGHGGGGGGRTADFVQPGGTGPGESAGAEEGGDPRGAADRWKERDADRERADPD